jgi:chromosome partitioning protein
MTDSLTASDQKPPLILAFCSFKGGVGKTTACLNLALRMAKAGQHIAVVDLDALGTATGLLVGNQNHATGTYDLLTGYGTRDGLSVASRIDNITVLPSTNLLHLAEVDPQVQALTAEDLRRRLQSGVGIDAILIDCGPGLGVTAVDAIAAADVVMVPVTPNPLALAGLERTLAAIADCDPAKPVQILLASRGEPAAQLESCRHELKSRFGDRVVMLRTSPLRPVTAQLAASA